MGIENMTKALIHQGIGVGTLIETVPAISTSPYSNDDVLWATYELTNFFREAGKPAWLVDVMLIDKSTQEAEIDLYFLKSNVSIGSLNGAIGIASGDAAEVLAHVHIKAGDITDDDGDRVPSYWT